MSENLDLNELFWNSSVSDMKRGYVFDEATQTYICVLCGEQFEDGIIYEVNGKLLEAKKAITSHISQEHNSVFEFLINMDKKYTGLTEHQRELLMMFFEGYKDKDIVNLTGGGSTSTIRNQRFMLKEREKQAKVFLCIMELLNGSRLHKKVSNEESLITIHRGATMVDDRYAITEKERAEVLGTYFNENRLKNFPVKEKKKIIVLQHILRSFELDFIYTEREVNEKLKEVNEDFVTLRRYMIEYGFMERTRDCKEYWVKK